MTIQLPLIIWTIICFSILYVILKYLLFIPMLDIMDKRQKKIDDAANAKKIAQKQLEKENSTVISEHKRKIEESHSKNEITADKMRMEGKEKLENAKKERISSVDNYRVKTETEYEEEMKKAVNYTEKAAERFLSNLFAN